MKILGRRGEKDFYDYLQNLYGIDELVVYDRRKSFPIDLSSFYIGYGLDMIFKKHKEFDDIKRKLVKGYGMKKSVLEGRFFYFVVESGYYHYFFKVERYLDDNDKVILEPQLIEKKKISKKQKLSECPLSICTDVIYTRYRGEVSVRRNSRNVVENPILKNTYIPKFIDAKEMWNNLYEYISSLRDKEFEDTRTNDQHIESHGFDKKISFRHRK
jgi:hypothetical protein